MSKWTKPQTSLLIKLLEQNSCLYDNLNPDYVNKTKRDKCYQTICKSLSKIRKGVNIREIKNKIVVLRGQYTREKKAIASSEKTCARSKEVYNPKLWCYENLKFFDGSMERDVISTSNIKSNTLESESDQNSSDDISMEMVVTPKKRKIPQLEERAASALNFVEAFSVEQLPETEELFCKYLSAEIKNIKLDHIRRKLKMDIASLVFDAIKHDKEEGGSEAITYEIYSCQYLHQ